MPRQYGHHFVDDIFKCIFFSEKVCITTKILTEVCFLESTSHLASIGSDNGLVSNMRQAIIWTSDGLAYWRIYASLGLNA